MGEQTARLDELVTSILASPKYRHVAPEFVRRLGVRELAKRRSLRAAIKATRDKLHQVGGAYFVRRLDYGGQLEKLRRARESGDECEFRRTCGEVMACHSSSRERLPILAEFYATTLGSLGPVRSVLDVACGLNPLALPWMPLAEGATYYACDIYLDMIDFVNVFLALVGVSGCAEVCDVAERCPTHEVEVALVLKSIPCLEQIDRAAGARLLAGLNARHILVSFPVHSLGGAPKGMLANYEAHFRELVAGRGWEVQRYEFRTELAFLVEKRVC